jgi:hypothetical protein
MYRRRERSTTTPHDTLLNHRLFRVRSVTLGGTEMQTGSSADGGPEEDMSSALLALGMSASVAGVATGA